MRGFLTMLIFVVARFAYILVLARVLLSWLPVGRDNSLVAFVYEATEPILAPIRRILPPVGGLDLAPLVTLILIGIIERLLMSLLAGSPF